MSIVWWVEIMKATNENRKERNVCWNKCMLDSLIHWQGLEQGIFCGKKKGILQPMYSQMAPSKVKENAQKQKRRRKTYKRFTYIWINGMLLKSSLLTTMRCGLMVRVHKLLPFVSVLSNSLNKTPVIYIVLHIAIT